MGATVHNCPHCNGKIGLHVGSTAKDGHMRLRRISLIKLPLICTICGDEYIPKTIITVNWSANRICGKIECKRATAREAMRNYRLRQKAGVLDATSKRKKLEGNVVTPPLEK